ncbi:MAG: hypothetical protein CL609_19115 [Anaerolineaceae bacterium]|nr:hypothetical protein [Anaerolineaceae bacterium]
MKKQVYFLFFLLALLVFAVNFIYQKNPGYMDADYYFLGGKYLAEKTIKAPFLWNYLDNPTGLPHPLFTYWKPLASIVTAIPLFMFGSDNFQVGRIIFYLIASLIPPLAIYFAYQITKNNFISYLVGFFVVFSGYYFKFFTIPETIALYVGLGALYFYTVFSLIKSSESSSRQIGMKTAVIGILSGLMAVTRVDGILYFGFSLLLVVFLQIKHFRGGKSFFLKILGYGTVCSIGFFLMMIPDCLINYLNFGSVSSPVGLKAIWINIYDDTFIYPANQLTFTYWLSAGWTEKMQNISNAFLLNLGTFSAVQLNVFGIPLYFLGVWRYKKEIWMKFFLFVSLSLFLFMTILFPLAGSRGGYLHAAASLQVVNWILISVGFYEFLLWGIKKRNWQLLRSKIMFGSAIILFSLVITSAIYYQDVIGSETNSFEWNQDYDRYSQIGKIISDQTVEKTAVVMINNPVGFHYQTGQWAITLPNSEWDQFLEALYKFNVHFLVLDENIPVRMKNYIEEMDKFTEIGYIPTYETTIYEIK